MIPGKRSKAAEVVVLGGIRDEVTRLLGDIKAYMAHDYAEDVADLSPGDTLRIHCESTRVTARLTCMVSWIALHHATCSGHLAPGDINRHKLALPLQEAYFTHCPGYDPGIPRRLQNLMRASLDLFVRMGRLYAQQTGASFQA